MFVAISKAAALGACAARTIRFSGTVAGHPALILIDSGSSSSFLSESLAAKLSSAVLTPQSTQVQVAGGGLLLSSGILRNVPWTLDQCTFHSDFRVLPLIAFDAIVGMDWLAAFNPMHVHWQQKWFSIPYHGDSVLLQGLDEESPSQLLLQLCQVPDTSAASSFAS